MLGSKQKCTLFIIFYLLSAVAVFLAWAPVKSVLTDPRIDLYYTHIPIIPLVSAFLLFRKRKLIFSGTHPAVLPGALLAIVGLCLYLIPNLNKIETSYSATLQVFSAILFWAGTYVGLFGFRSLRKGLFPVLFLLFAVPIPAPIMDRFVLLIAGASVYVTGEVFTVLQVPFIREGVTFYLPAYTLVVGPECAGWRSSLALIILSLLAGHLFLKRLSNKILLVAVSIPVIIIKNAVRIVLLYYIAYYLDERFMESGFLHRSVGYFMFGLVLIFMGFLLWSLEKREAQKPDCLKS
jgi:exosortase